MALTPSDYLVAIGSTRSGMSLFAPLTARLTSYVFIRSESYGYLAVRARGHQVGLATAVQFRRPLSSGACALRNATSISTTAFTRAVLRADS